MSSDDVVAFKYFDTSCIIPYCVASRNRELSFEYDIHLEMNIPFPIDVSTLQNVYSGFRIYIPTGAQNQSF
jgi:hypothetical protein